MNTKNLLTLGKASLSVALICWLALTIDLNRLWTVASGLGYPALMGAALLFALQGLIVGWRWHRIVQLLGGTLPSCKAVEWVFVGLFFNQALPTSVGGDLIRIWNLHRLGSAPGLAFASVAIERATGVAALGLLITLCMPTVWNVFSPPVQALLLSAGPCLVAILFLLAFIDRIAMRWLPRRPVAHASALASGLRKLTKSGKAAAEIFGLGMAASLVVICAAFVIGHGLSINLPFPTFVVTVGGAILLSVLPVSLGGWGVREVSMVALFGALGVAPEPALAMSLMWGVLQLIVALPGGVAWWLDDRSRTAAARGEAGRSIADPTATASQHADAPRARRP